MLSLFQRFIQERLCSFSGFRQKYSSNRPNVLILFRKRLNENATRGIDAG